MAELGNIAPTIAPERPKQIAFGLLNVRDGARKEQVVNLIAEAYDELFPKPGSFNEPSFYKNLNFVLVNYAEIGGEVKAVVFAQQKKVGRVNVEMLESVTAREERGQGLREQLIRNVLATDQLSVFGIHTWRVDSVTYPELPLDYPEEERAVHALSNRIVAGEQIDAKNERDAIKRLARVVKVDDSNTAMGFRLVQGADGTRTQNINYVFVRPWSGVNMDELALSPFTEGNQRINAFRSFLTALADPAVYDPLIR